MDWCSILTLVGIGSRISEMHLLLFCSSSKSKAGSRCPMQTEAELSAAPVPADSGVRYDPKHGCVVGAGTRIGFPVVSIHHPRLGRRMKPAALAARSASFFQTFNDASCGRQSSCQGTRNDVNFLNFDFKNLRGDIFGGLTSTVVGLPIALAFGVASGLGALAGLYGAIAVGFFAAFFGGTRSQISGPTGPMAIVMSAVVATHAENLAQAFAIVILAGVIQILLGIFKIGRFVSFTPYSAISGFMSGVGIIIMTVQTLPFLGWAVAEGGPIGAIRTWPDVLRNFDSKALAIGAASLVVAVALPDRARKYVPPPLAALAVGTLLAVVWLRGTPVIGEVPTGLPQIQWPVGSSDMLAKSISPAITMALLGSIDSLLTSLVADAMTRTRHNPDRELIGQGIGNLMSGLIGGVPGAGLRLPQVAPVPSRPATMCPMAGHHMPRASRLT